MGDTDCSHKKSPSNSKEEFASNGGGDPLIRILRALADKRSRLVCYYVVDNEPCNIEACAERVAARETDLDPTDTAEGTHQRIKADLYHTHLPKLDELGIIEYDERSGDLRCQHHAPHFKELLDVIRKLEDD